MNKDTKIGDVELDEDERSILKMNPKFAVMKRIRLEDIETEIEIGFSKIRYEIAKRKTEKLEEGIEFESLDGKKRKIEAGYDNSKESIVEEARLRQVYDPIGKTFDYSKKRVTDLQECAEIILPKPGDDRIECELEMIRDIMIDEFNSYKTKIEKDLMKRNKTQKEIERNQEWSNLSKKEKKGLVKLQKRIRNDEIAILKTDKSGKLAAISKDDYKKMGLSLNKSDKKVTRKEMLKIEKEINDHTRMLVKCMNMGEKNDHLQRILDSKLTTSELSAPMYYMFKDHKAEGGWRPVVSGCSSNTLGLSNLVSEMIESVCSAVINPYEVISSTDMLSRIESFNKWLNEEQKRKIEAGIENWDWQDDMMLLGSDVVALFPSLSATNTSKIVRKQVTKSPIVWQNIDHTWLRLYVHLNRNMTSDISKIEHLLPYKKKGRPGKESGMSSMECKKRRLNINGKKSCWDWPEQEVTENDVKELLGIAMEIVVNFFFTHFVYTFGGEHFLQCSGGPIGARLTMCIARLVMQDWSETFSQILKENKLKEMLRGIYVDDGRNVIELLRLGVRYNIDEKKFIYKEEWEKSDLDEGMSRRKKTEKEIAILMNSINEDLKFTTETEKDFVNLRLPTLSFEVWSENSGIRHSYYEKGMRSQVLTMQRSSMAEKSKYSILVNEIVRRFEVMEDNLPIKEQISIIDHYTKQLRNSEYEYKQSKDIIVSALKGILSVIQNKE